MPDDFCKEWESFLADEAVIRFKEKVNHALNTLNKSQSVVPDMEKMRWVYTERVANMRKTKWAVRDFLDAMEKWKKLLLVWIQSNIRSRSGPVDFKSTRIVELVGILLDSELTLIDCSHSFITLPPWEELSPLFDDDWGLNKDILDEEWISFHKAYFQLLRLFNPEDTVLASWTESELLHLESETKHFGTFSPFFDDEQKGYDIQDLVGHIVWPERKTFDSFKEAVWVQPVDLIEDSYTKTLEASLLLWEVFGQTVKKSTDEVK